MSRACTAGSFLAVDTSLINDEPLSIFCWFKRTGTANTQTFVAIGAKDDASGNDSFVMQVNNSDVIQGTTRRSTSATAVAASVGNDTASWHTAAFVTSGAASRFAYLDGTPGTEQTSSIAVTSASVNCIRIGKHTQSGSVNVLEALIAHVAIWNTALSGTDITNLHGGDNPLTVQSSNLKGYWPLDVDSMLDSSGSALTLTDSSTSFNADNPTVDAPPAASGQPTIQRFAAIPGMRIGGMKIGRGW